MGDGIDGADLRASRAAGRILTARFVSMVAVFAGSVALARLLGAADRGAHGYVIAVSTLLTTMLAFGAPVGGYVLVSRRGMPMVRLGANAIWLSLAAGAAAGIIGALLKASGITPAPLRQLETWPYALAVATAGFVLNTHLIQLTLGIGRAVPGAILAFGPYTIAAVGYLGLPAMHGSLVDAVWLYALAPWTGVGIGWVVLRSRLGLIAWPDLTLVLGTLRQGIRNYPGEVAQLAQQRGDVLLIGMLASSASVGTYVVAYQTAEPILAISSAAGAAILALGPGADDERTGGAVSRLIRESLLLGTSLAGVAAIVAPAAIPWLYGPEFDASVGPFLLLLPALVALTIARIAMADLVRRNRLGITATIAIAALAANLAANIALIPPLGALGAAIASLVSYTGTCVALLAVDRAIGAFRWSDLRPTRGDIRGLLAAWGRRRVRRSG